MATSFDAFEMLLRENISDAVVNLTFEDEDPASLLIDTFNAETLAGRNQSIGAENQSPDPGYRASYRIRVQRGGRVAGAKLFGNTTTMMGGTNQLTQLMGQAADGKYLDPRRTPGPGWLEVAMKLRRVKGSVVVNRDQIIAELAANPIDEVAGNYLMDSVARVRSYQVNAFWGDGTASLAQVNASSSVLEASAVSVTLGQTSAYSGTFARFQQGDLLQAATTHATLRVLKTGTGASGATGYIRVVKVDRINRKLFLQSEPGVGTVALVDTDHLMYADTYDFVNGHAEANKIVPEGVESLVINTGTFPGTNYAVENVTELIAFTEDVTTTPEDPTPENIAKILDTIADGGYQPPTALFSERSFWTYYSQLERESGAQYVVSQGAAFQASGGVDGPVVQHMGTRFQRFPSTRMRTQTLVGLAPDEWMKFVPLGNNAIHWVYGNGPMAGVQSVFFPVSDGVQGTELARADYDTYCQFGNKIPGRQFWKRGYKTQRTV